MGKDNNNEYKTKSLDEVAALLLKNQKLLCIQRDGDICWFVFEHTPACEEISMEFYFGNLLVNAREYFETLKMLRGKVQPK